MPGFHKSACAKPQNYANGGFVPQSKREGVIRGPGTGTSDSIRTEIPEGSYIMPADSTAEIGPENVANLGFKPGAVQINASNGEFAIPPEQVHAVGVQALDRMKAATHTPAREQGDESQSRPELFFADGGLVSEEARRRAAQAAGGMPAEPTPTISGYGGTAVRSPSTASRQAATPPADSSAQPASSSSGFMPGTRAIWNNSGDAIKGAYQQGGVPAAAAETTRAALAYPLAVADDVVGTPARMAWSAATNFGKTLFSGDPTPNGSAPATQAPQTKQMAAAAPSASAKPDSPVSTPVPSAPATTAAPVASDELPNNVTRVGNSYSGKDISGDFTINGQAPGGGAISARNDSAAQALSDRYASQDAARGAVLAQAQAQPQSAGFRPNTGLADERLTDGKQSELISLASQPMKGSQNGQLTANQLRVLSDIHNQDANRVTASDNAAMHDALSRDLNAQNNAAAAQRALLSETGTNQRFAAANALDQQKVQLAQESQGFQTRALKRQEDLTSKWEAAKTPEEKSAIAQQIRALSGKSDAGGWKPVVLQGGTDAMGNRTESVMGAVNEATGEMRRYDDVAKPKEAIAVGTRSKVNGKTAVFDGKKWIPE